MDKKKVCAGIAALLAVVGAVVALVTTLIYWPRLTKANSMPVASFQISPQNAVECRSEPIVPIPTVDALLITCNQPIFQSRSTFGDEIVLTLYNTEGVDNVGLESTPAAWRYSALVVLARDRRFGEVDKRVEQVIRKFFPQLKYKGSPVS